jgi:hypothetical protein
MFQNKKNSKSETLLILNISDTGYSTYNDQKLETTQMSFNE